MRKKEFKKEFTKAFKSAFPLTLPVLAGYLVLGFGFGLLLQSKGYNFVWAIFMAIIIYGGSMQYIAVDLLSSGATIITTAIISIMMQARHLFYGISLLGKYRKIGKVKPYLIFGLTDETYGLVSSTKPPEGVKKNYFYFIITLCDHIYWITGCALGAIFGQLVHINTKGVEFSMTALFIVILVDKLLEENSRIPAIVGLAVSLVCLLIFGADNFLIPAMIGIAGALVALKPVLNKNSSKENKEEKNE